MALKAIVIDTLSTSGAFKPHILYDSFEEVGELKKVVFITSWHIINKWSSEKH